MRPFTYSSSYNFCSAGSRLWAPVSAHEILNTCVAGILFSVISPAPLHPAPKSGGHFASDLGRVRPVSKNCKEPFLERFFSQSLIQKSTYMLRLQSVPLVTSYLTRLNCFVELRCTILPLSSCRIRLGLVK